VELLGAQAGCWQDGTAEKRTSSKGAAHKTRVNQALKISLIFEAS
jgi:hypothetical protein